MFNPKTDRIKKIYQNQPKGVDQLMSIFSGKVNMYIDYANVRPWADTLGWHIDVRRLKQFINSFSCVDKINFYVGCLDGNTDSMKFIRDIKKYKYELRTKPVKIMKYSIDTTSVPLQSTVLINQFMRSALVRKLEVAEIENINRIFSNLNKRDIYYIEDRKCNFDVELGSDMIMNLKQNDISTYVLWSGDSDFADSVEQILNAGKKVILFATARKVATELNGLRSKGLFIFDIKKIKNYICWRKEIDAGLA
ncbi:NYN domain-containing protein [Candidatus Parcubacteria bacterium]|nr:NYN domain-containing protein [Candidatus Parcubacteria bacterium]